MYLTIEEMKNSKSRYISMVLVITLIGLVIFLSSSLAEGLAVGNRMEIERWDAQSIEVSEASNKNISASMFEVLPFESDEKARVSMGFSTLKNKGEEAINISIVAYDKGSFIEPKLIEGNEADLDSVMVSAGFKNKGIELGDIIRLDDKQDFEVIGFSDATMNFLSEIVYMSQEQYQEFRFGAQTNVVNAIVYKSSDEGLSVGEIINAIPGYVPQKLTLNLIIYFLIGISSAIVAIFIYIMTLQKKSIFGVLKAQGTPNKYLRNSVVAQSAIISLVSLLISIGLTYLISLLLPSAVPFYFDLKMNILYALILWVFSLLGSVFSVRSVTKIDPIEAIGGGL